MNEFFNWCCKVLYQLEAATGISYEAINIWLFVIIQPALVLLFFGLFVRYFRKYRKLKKKLSNVK